MRPMALVLACLAASAHSAETQKLPGVRIWLKFPAQPTEQQLKQLPASEALVRQLFGKDSARKPLPSEDGRFSYYYESEAWDKQLGPEQRGRLIGLLKGIWKEDLRIEEPAQALGQAPEAASKARPEPKAIGKAVDRKAASEEVARAVPAPLLKDRQGLVYDGSQGAAALGGRPVSAPGEGGGQGAAGYPSAAVQAGLATSASPMPRTGLQAGPLPTLARSDAPQVPLPAAKGLPSSEGPRTAYDAVIEREAKDAGVDPALVRAVIEAKSGFDPQKRGGGAHGLMMVTYGAAKGVGVKDGDLSDPETNIRVGSRLLGQLLKQFGGDAHRALAAYQVGAGAVIRSGGIPKDRDVKDFLAAYEKAYRQGPAKPAVEPVRPPSAPLLREVRETVGAAVVYRAPGNESDPVAKYKPLIDAAAAKYGVDRDLVEAVVRQEDPWGDPKRKSDCGAVGLMQLMPGTARHYGVKDRKDPGQNIDGGTRYLKDLLERFDGDKVLAVAAYNAGPTDVDRLDRVPNYKQTVHYVAKVFGYYKDLSGETVDYSRYLTPKAQGWVKTSLARHLRPASTVQS